MLTNEINEEKKSKEEPKNQLTNQTPESIDEENSISRAALFSYLLS